MKKIFNLDKSARTMRHAGGWCIALGIVTLTVGVSVGVGNIIVGGRLLSSANRE